jgi:hypothetical protein
MIAVVLLIALCGLIGCTKAPGPTAPSIGTESRSASNSMPTSDAVQQKLQEYSGAGATDCGRLDVHAAEPELKKASECAHQANQGKHAFYIAYDMPGMTVGVAGNAASKLFTVQSQGTGSSAALNSGDCPSPLRVASSGRVTCFAPGDMGSMGAGHNAGAVPPGTANPHGTGSANPHPAPKMN